MGKSTTWTEISSELIGKVHPENDEILIPLYISEGYKVDQR